MTTETRSDYITIFASTAQAAMAQFRARGLDRAGYSITGPMGKHQVGLVAEDGFEQVLSGEGLVALTFARRTPVPA